MKTFFEELSPNDIYDFYFIYTGLSYEQINLQDHNLAEFYLREIKDRYLKTFGNMLAEQIKRYYDWGRADLGLKISQLDSSNFVGLKELMQQTLRSDKKGRNEVWNGIADYVYKLSLAHNARDICSIIDRINHAVHNTETIVLSKLGYPFMQAYDNVHKSKTPKDYVQFVSPEIRRLMKVWYRPDEIK